DNVAEASVGEKSAECTGGWTGGAEWIAGGPRSEPLDRRTCLPAWSEGPALRSQIRPIEHRAPLGEPGGSVLKVVVTGGAGFIGANLCRFLAAAPEVTEVVALDDLSTGFAENLDGVDATLVTGSLTAPDDLDAVLPGAASVVHLGARPSVPRSLADPVASHDTNATGTLQVLEAMRRHGVEHVVVASSSSVYG